ncbi:MAG: hypothetical protein WCL22_06815, partial [bacterium]
MRTLRKYNKNNKIKNRYIITMVYKNKTKTRKIRKTNKRRYLQNIKSRRMYGGFQDGGDDLAANKILDKIDEQNKVEFPALKDIPFVGPIIEKTGNLVEGALVKGIDVMGNSIGVDVDNPGSISEKLNNIKEDLNNPENVENAKAILGNAGKYIEVGIEAASPVIEEMSDKILPVVTKEADKAIKAGVATGVNLVEDVAGPFIGIPRTLLSAATAFNASVNAGSELVKGVAETVQGTQDNYNRIINETKIPEMPTLKMPIPNEKDYNYQGDGARDSFKKLHKEALMVGGRSRKSHLDFL